MNTMRLVSHSAGMMGRHKLRTGFMMIGTFKIPSSYGRMKCDRNAVPARNFDKCVNTIGADPEWCVPRLSLWLTLRRWTELPTDRGKTPAR